MPSTIFVVFLGVLVFAAISQLLLHHSLAQQEYPTRSGVDPGRPERNVVGSFRLLPAFNVSGKAISGLAIAPAVGPANEDDWFLAVANYYGESELFQLDARAENLDPRSVQRFATKAAHDWESAALPGGRVQLIAAEYDNSHSFVYERHTPGAMESARALASWPECQDSDPKACHTWAKAGECCASSLAGLPCIRPTQGRPAFAQLVMTPLRAVACAQ